MAERAIVVIIPYSNFYDGVLLLYRVKFVCHKTAICYLYITRLLQECNLLPVHNFCDRSTASLCLHATSIQKIHHRMVALLCSLCGSGEDRGFLDVQAYIFFVFRFFGNEQIVLPISRSLFLPGVVGCCSCCFTWTIPPDYFC